MRCARNLAHPDRRGDVDTELKPDAVDQTLSFLRQPRSRVEAGLLAPPWWRRHFPRRGARKLRHALGQAAGVYVMSVVRCSSMTAQAR